MSQWPDYLFIGFFSVFGLFAAFVFLVMLPVIAYTDMKCAEAGYPKSKVTINLQRYCMTLDGAVTVKMEQL